MNHKENPKNYPHWETVVSSLRAKGYYVIQVGVKDEPLIGADSVRHGMSLKDLKELLMQSSGWISVDNFFNHFATYHGKRGIVIFGRSDPEIFGYPQNINLLKDRTCLREKQFELWEQDEFNADVFVAPENVVSAIDDLFR